ncbi:MAG: hypothetical protein AB8A46_07300 [Prochlorococcus sp.]|jgi:membrane protein DedA with SNARE-associated domain|nr:hypothetical protein [Prochlorococcaceae cyanobacterium ETNP18_MAG_1]CAI8167185.1 MAG: Uncharacterised protein [Prochlorococcus marinus str. MIT 9215]
MTLPPTEPIWKQWLDRLLIVNVFVVISGALWFGVAVLAMGQGITSPMQRFEQLWGPLFTPAIGLLMAAALINAAWDWWQQRGPGRDRDSET